MTVLKTFLCITAGCLVASSLCADIYKWTDKDGVTHYTNYAPPPEAIIIMKTEEQPYDEAADRARLEAERQERLELKRLELADREAELERREAQTEQRLADADRQAEETLREAEKILNEARNGRYDYRNYRYADYYGSYYPYHYKDRYYYRNETGSIHFTKPRHKDHIKRYRNKNHHYGYGYDNTYRRSRYDDQKHSFIRANRLESGPRSNNRNHRGQLSIQSHSSSHTGLGLSDRAYPVSRSRRN